MAGAVDKLEHLWKDASMAMDQETEIMRAIGLGQHYTWFNGSGSCRGIRQAAVRSLPAALSEAGLRPDSELMEIARLVAEWGDEDMYVLTETWQACSYIIAAHIHGKDNPEEMDHQRKWIVRNYEHLKDQWGPLRTADGRFAGYGYQRDLDMYEIMR